MKIISEGSDPKKEKQEALKAVTMAELFDIYYKYHALPNKKQSSANWDKNAFQRHIGPVIGEIKAENIRRRDIISLLDDVAVKSPVMRNRLQNLLSVMFNIGIDRELVENNPTFRMKKVKEVSRDRVLAKEEVVALWTQWERVRMGPLFMFKLLTGQRDQEVRTMRWSDIEDGIWIIPKERTKNKKPHAVPLSTQAAEIIATIPRRGEHVFFSARGAAGHVISTKKSFRACRDAAGLSKDTRGHDLRRTAATNMGDIGISDSVIGAILNHSDGSVTSIYNRSTQLEAKRQALQKWADKLYIILGLKSESSKVVKLRLAG